MKYFLPVLIAGFGLLFYVSPAAAQDRTDQQIKEMQKTIHQLRQRIAALESRQAAGISGSNAFGQGDPFDMLDRMQENMQREVQKFWENGQMTGMFSSQIGFNNQFNMKETPSAYMITFDLKDLDPEDISIDVTPTSLTIKGEYSHQEVEQNPDAYLQARQYGSFARTISLPKDADTTRLQTQKQGEQLMITLPKRSQKRDQTPNPQESLESQRLKKFQRIVYSRV